MSPHGQRPWRMSPSTGWQGEIGQGGATWRNPDKAGAVGELHRVADARRSHKPSDKRRVTLQNGTACERKQKPAPEHRNRDRQEDPASPMKKARPRRRAEDVDSQTREGEPAQGRDRN